MLFLLKRLCGLVAVLFLMTLVIFLLQEVVPADPARAAVGPNAPRAQVEAKRLELGLDKPVLVRFGLYLGRLAQGDLGTSIRTRHPVALDIASALPASLELLATGLILGIVLGLVLAFSYDLPVLGAPIRAVLIGSASAPVFLTAMLLVILFWFRLGWLPGSGRTGIAGIAGPTGLLVPDALMAGRLDGVADALSHLALPALTLALPMGVAVGRTLKSSMIAVLRQTYIRTARSKGLSEPRIVLRHVLRNAAQAPLAMVGLQIGLVSSNLLIVERIFGWPGIGLYAVQATGGSDLPAVLGVSLVFAVIYIVLNMGIELVQGLIDPRLTTS